MKFLGGIVLIRADDLGDLGEREIIVVVKDYHRAHIGRQGVDYRLELLLGLGVDGVVIGEKYRRGERGKLGCAVDTSAVCGGLFIIVCALVVGDTVKPADKGLV